MGDDPLSFLEREVPRSFERRLVVLAPGEELAYDEAVWRGTLVVVECGTLELESTRGCRRELATGSVLWLSGLPVRTLRNRGEESLILSAVSRR